MITVGEITAYAHSYFSEFGFDDEQIERLTLQGTVDLNNLLQQLKEGLEADELKPKEIDDTLHAIKGIVAQLGNTELAKQLTDIRKDLNEGSSLHEIYRLFFKAV